MKDLNINKSLKSLEGDYLEGNYENVIAGHLELKKQLPIGQFHYNLGTSYVKNGQYAAGRYHLEKALIAGHDPVKTMNNLSLVKSKLQVSDIGNSENFLDRGIDCALTAPSSIYLTIGLLFIISGLFIGRLKKQLISLVSILCFVIAFCILGFRYFYLDNIDYAILLKNDSIYEGPSKIFEKKMDVSAGSKFIIGQKSDGWFFIKHPVELSGWVEKKNLGIY